MRTLVWFRGKDLRVGDHGPLAAAAAAGGDVIPVFCLDPYFFKPDRAQELPHRMQFLLESLESLRSNLASLGSRLLLVEGRATERIPELASRWQVDRVVAHRWVEPFGRERDRRIASRLGALGVPFDLHEGETLAPPGSILTQGGTMFGVFTPFARAFRRSLEVSKARPAPRALPPVPGDLLGDVAEIPSLESLGIRHNPRLLPGGEKAARRRMKLFLDAPIFDYQENRNRMDREGVSRLSADLKFGTLSVRTLWRGAMDWLGRGRDEDVGAYLLELLWREFSHHLLWDRPDLLEQPFRPSWQGFPWAKDETGWLAWAEGRTGYPVVDAAARQLRAEGFVHNRARMIAASFLTKDLHISYQRGEAHYMKWLTDGDWAQNNAGWQWTSGCGCDAQPWFRIFNPVVQGQRFDPEGAYVKRWLPELSEVDAKWIHSPWRRPESHGNRLDYPPPVVDHNLARLEFLSIAKQHLGTSKEAGSA